MKINQFSPNKSSSAIRSPCRKRPEIFALLTLTLVLITGCQSVPTSQEQIQNFRQVEAFLAVNKLNVTGSATGVRESSITDWGPLNNQALILALGSDQQVLVTLKDPCENLEHARVIGFDRAQTIVVLDPMGQGFDIRQSSSEYLNPGDRVILALTNEELEDIRWQPMGPTFGQLGECTAEQIYHLESFEEQNSDDPELDLIQGNDPAAI